MEGFSKYNSVEQYRNEMLNFAISVESDSNSSVAGRLDDFLGNTGKRARPLLVMLFSDLFSIDEEQAMKMAKAIEMTHSASLVHDDVIDVADYRRGNQTIAALESNKKAILAGDYLLASTVRILTELEDTKVIRSLTQAIMDLVDGEWLQADLINNPKVEYVDLLAVAQKKTSSLMIWACIAPAIFSKQDEEVVELCREIGDCLGIGFQMLDDVWDTSNLNEKAFLKDLHNGLINFVIQRVYEKNYYLYEEVYKIKGKQNFKLPWTDDQLKYARIEIMEEATSYFNKAQTLFIELHKRLGQENEMKYEIFSQALSMIKDSFASDL